MSFISYAQNFEDVMLWRALGDIKNGYYIDVGANHPMDDSVTKAFYNHGWSGINIEPEERFFNLLVLDRDRDINLDVAISNQTEDIKLYVFETRGWSTNDISVADEHRADGYDYQIKSIKTKSLDRVCEENQVEEIHFLKIDVEGAEKSVLESFSFEQYRPWIVVIEATRPNTDIDVSQEWEYMLFDHSYLLAYFDGINKFYVAKEHSSLLAYFRYPPNAFDDFISINQYSAEMRASEYESKLDIALKRVEESQTVADDTRYSADLRAVEYESKIDLALMKAVEAEKIADDVQQSYQLIVDSSSWRITKPLRQIKDIIHRLKRDQAHRDDPEVTEQKRQLLVDLSQIYFDDNQTGIQRVIHNIISQLSMLDIEGYRVLPIYATMEKGYHYTSKFNSDSAVSSSLDEQPVVVEDGDIFLGLDLSAHLFPQIEETLQHYRESGVSINYLIYDIIPLLRPEFTTEGMDGYFRTWLDGLMRHSDRLICISRSVADELGGYIDDHYPEIESRPEIASFHLGAGIGSCVGSEELTPDADRLLAQMQKRLTFLMVGTVEPRKGHSQVLSAFEKLWAEGYDIDLVIVGKRGWMVDELLVRLADISDQNGHLIWLEGISDEYLERVYTASSSLIIASETEGFGLPIIEAAKYNLPVIARDIPIFREIAEDHALYFDDDLDADTVFRAIAEWISLYDSGSYPESKSISWLTWRDSTLQLLGCLNINIKA
ncbi:MAG: FkbM family methyltransferase [Campylobacterota bacterium]|nr:FkbM family methyltransferase [Campylobacterota bacterium]